MNKVDDNGFVTLNLQPEISVPISAGVQEGIQIFNISARNLNLEMFVSVMVNVDPHWCYFRI